MKRSTAGRHDGTRKERTTKRTGAQTADPNPASTPRRDVGYLLAVTVLSAITLLAFSNSFSSGFILDNKGLLLDPRLREATQENIALIFHHTYWWPTGEAGLYRPFTTLSYLFNYAVLGEGSQPAGYHWVNLGLHLCNVLLAFVLARRLLPKFWPPVFLAGLWAVHPALTESVTNIVGRADLIAAMAVLSGLLMYLKSAEAGSWRRAPWLVGLAIATTIGVFSKESAVAILPLIVLYELAWWKGLRRLGSLALGCAATLLPIGVMFWQRSLVLAASAPAEFPFTDNPVAGADWWTGRLTAIQVMAKYAWLAVFPMRLSCDYSYDQIPLAHGVAAAGLACAIVVAAAAMVILLYRWNRACFFLACFAFLNFVPASNLLFPIGTIMADRLLYLPALGLLGCLVPAVYAAARALRMAALAPLVLCLVTAGFAIRTWIRNSDWQSELSIAAADVRVSPNSYKLHRLLASSLFESDPSHSNIDQVIAEIDKSVSLLESLPDALRPHDVYRLAGYYDLVKSRQRDRAENSALYQSAIRNLQHSLAATGERDPQTYLLLSVAYLESGNPEKALDPANQARMLDPLNPQIYRELSAALLAQGQRPEAEMAAAVEETIRALQQGKWEDAAELSNRVLQLDRATYPVTYYLNAMANLRLGNLDAAETGVRTAIRLDGAQRNPKAGYVLGLVLAQKKDYAKSAELLKAYLSAVPEAPEAGAIRRQLRDIESLAGAPVAR